VVVCSPGSDHTQFAYRPRCQIVPYPWPDLEFPRALAASSAPSSGYSGMRGRVAEWRSGAPEANGRTGSTLGGLPVLQGLSSEEAIRRVRRTCCEDAIQPAEKEAMISDRVCVSLVDTNRLPPNRVLSDRISAARRGSSASPKRSRATDFRLNPPRPLVGLARNARNLSVAAATLREMAFTDFAEVVPRLYVGAHPEPESAFDFGADVVVCLTANPAIPSPHSGRLLVHWPIKDGPVPRPEVLRSLAGLIDTFLKQGAVVYVHCQADEPLGPGRGEGPHGPGHDRR
jgi:hypothetical protein